MKLHTESFPLCKPVMQGVDLTQNQGTVRSLAIILLSDSNNNHNLQNELHILLNMSWKLVI